MQNILVSAILVAVPTIAMLILLVIDVRSFGGDKLIRQYGWSKTVSGYVIITVATQAAAYAVYSVLP